MTRPCLLRMTLLAAGVSPLFAAAPVYADRQPVGRNAGYHESQYRPLAREVFQKLLAQMQPVEGMQWPPRLVFNAEELDFNAYATTDTVNGQVVPYVVIYDYYLDLMAGNA